MPWIGAAIGAGASLLGQSRGRKADQRSQESAFANSESGLRLGNELDMQNQRDMFDFRLNRARHAGLTNVEAFGSGAASPGGGTTGSGQTLGNAANQNEIAAAERNKDRETALQRDLLNAGTQIQQTKMQTDTQKEVAGMQTGATERGQDIQKAIADGRLNLDRDSLALNTKLAAANIGKTEQETKKLINEVATSDSDFVVYMKQLTMGADNMLVEYFQRHHGINLANPKSFTSLPVQKREALLSAMLGLQSQIQKEASGSGISSFLGNIKEMFNSKPGIEPSPQLGSPAQQYPGRGRGRTR